METVLVKIFATALALSQVTTTPESVATQFDRTIDQATVGQLLHVGCTHRPVSPTSPGNNLSAHPSRDAFRIKFFGNALHHSISDYLM